MSDTDASNALPKVDLTRFRKSLDVKGWPIKAAIASAVISSMLILAIALITLGYRGERESMLAYTTKIAGDAGQLIEQKALRILEPAQVALRLLAGASLAEAVTLEQRLDRVRQAMDVLAASSVSSAVFVGYSDGSFMLVRALGTPALRQRMSALSPVALPVPEPLLADRPEHLVPWGDRRPAVERGDAKNRHGFDMHLPAHQQNMGELHNLCTRKGTLTEEDRFRINDHIVQTLVMLRNLPWPAHLAKVPDIAATHHEKMDGQAYPRRLAAEQLALPDRVMALADIFEALTAADRPDKTPKTLSESLKIMAAMANDGPIDPELFRYFLKSNLWQEFARQYLNEQQIDPANVAAIERLLPAARADTLPSSL